MFARLKRKHDDDEEPLVPHGLIWQATDEPTPSEEESRVAKTPSLEDNQVSPQVVEMPANAKPLPQDDPPRKLGAISPPLQWPSPKIQEIARHPDTRVARQAAPPLDEPQKKPPMPVDAPVAKATAEFAVAPPPTPKLILVARESTASWVKVGLGNVRSAVLFCGSRARAISADALRALAAFRIGLRERVQRVNVKGRMVNAHGFARARIETWRRKSQSLGVAAARNLTEWQKAAALRSQSGFQKSVETVKAIDFRAPARSLQRAHNLKVTIRIPHQDLARIVAAISAVRAPWNRVRQAVNRDSRLWMSMAMAGLSALLALGFVTALPRYQPESSPSAVAATDSPDSATTMKPADLILGPPVASNRVASPTAQRPSAAIRKRKNAAVKHTKVAVSRTVNPVTTRPAPTKSPSRKAHNSEDDDYVARDTYVLYGSNGKPQRR